MQINVFRGGRRIALLFAALATILVLGVTATNHPYIFINYQVLGPNRTPVRAGQSCPSDARSNYFDASTPNGHAVYINLCFATVPFGKDAQQLVPYKVDASGTLWGAPAYSEQVEAYAELVQNRFSLPSSDGAWADAQIAHRYRANWLHTLAYLVIGLLTFWALVWAIGWIARGFAGIPHGHDRRPHDDKSEENS